MSLANFYNLQQNQLVIPSLDVSNLEINDVPFNGGGITGSSYDIINTDGSITITKGATAYTLSDAGKNWSTYPPLTNINLDNSNLFNTRGLIFKNGLSIYQLNAGSNPNLSICNFHGNTLLASGNIFDSYFNYPYLSTIIAKNGNAQAGTITNLNKIQITNEIDIGDFVITKSQSGDLNIMNGESSQLTLKSNGDVIISDSGKLYVSNGVNQGQVYDTYFNIPSGETGSEGKTIISMFAPGNRNDNVVLNYELTGLFSYDTWGLNNVSQASGMGNIYNQVPIIVVEAIQVSRVRVFFNNLVFTLTGGNNYGSRFGIYLTTLNNVSQDVNSALVNDLENNTKICWLNPNYDGGSVQFVNNHTYTFNNVECEYTLTSGNITASNLYFYVVQWDITNFTNQYSIQFNNIVATVYYDNLLYSN
jgi:hypothetical protein